MRILFFLHNMSKTRHFEGVLELLAERGHSIVLAAARQRNRPVALPKSLSQVNQRLKERRSAGRIEIIPCPSQRVDGWQDLAVALREARDYVRFFDPRYADARKLAQRAAMNTSDGIRALLDRPFVRRHWHTAARLLQAAENAIPSEKLFELYITYEQPDVVLITPLVDYRSYQPDYVKSAHALGVPVVFLPFSWDNLTNRGLIRVEPDLALVWNDLQRKEAVEMQGVAPERVVVVGAPRFDEFFSMKPSSSRADFCGSLGLNPARPFVLYLCSAPFVAPREVEFVQRWIDAIRQSDDPVVRTCGILVRPHPVHERQWREADVPRIPNTALWTAPETLNADQGLFDSLYHAGAVAGLNTSAMIEAAIVGTPVHGILAPEFSGGQEQTLHFHYLRAQNGGVLHEARTLDEHVAQLADSLRANRHERATSFLQRFVRPQGLDIPVAPLMADAIERSARLRSRPRRWTPLSHRVARLALRTAFSVHRTATGRSTLRRADA